MEKLGFAIIPPEPSPILIINLTPAAAVTLPDMIEMGRITALVLAAKSKEPAFAIV